MAIHKDDDGYLSTGDIIDMIQPEKKPGKLLNVRKDSDVIKEKEAQKLANDAHRERMKVKKMKEKAQKNRQLLRQIDDAELEVRNLNRLHGSGVVVLALMTAWIGFGVVMGDIATNGIYAIAFILGILALLGTFGLAGARTFAPQDFPVAKLRRARRQYEDFVMLDDDEDGPDFVDEKQVEESYGLGIYYKGHRYVRQEGY